MLKEKLLKLSATEFENLIYDLMIIKGLRNATWRTPGADGGRDIEGNYIFIDLSENVEIQKWYIECKRYSNSVDWPTVYAKVAYAVNHNADYSLMCTTSNFSPNCKTEITRWNQQSKRPLIRIWDSVELDRKILSESVISIKYKLQSNKTVLESSIIPLTQVASKVIQSNYGLIKTGRSMSLYENHVEYSAALVELISTRIEWASLGFSMNPRLFIQGRDLYEWCDLDSPISFHKADSYGLRALLCAIKFYTGSATIRISDRLSVKTDAVRKNREEASIVEGQFYITPTIDLTSKAIREALSIISIWSNLEHNITNEAILVTTRDQ